MCVVIDERLETSGKASGHFSFDGNKKTLGKQKRPISKSPDSITNAQPYYVILVSRGKSIQPLLAL